MKLCSGLETSAAVFHSMLTQENSDDIERIQKGVTRIIMGTRYTSYEEALTFLDLEPLEKRRETLCLSFALKCLKNEKFKHLFVPNPEVEYDLRKVSKFIMPYCAKDRYKSSPLIYLTHILNVHFDKNID